MRKIIFLFFFLKVSALYADTETIHSVVNQIVAQLHHANGNYLYGDAPKVVIREKKSNGASYNFRTHTLYFDTALYGICQEFKTQTDDAIAFIVGHELAHCYMEYELFNQHNHYHWLGCEEIEKEKSADIYGLFNCYLAGYKSHLLLPELLVELYDNYELPDILDSYPSKIERQNSTLEVLTIVNKLIHVYEGANYLSVIGAYDLAKASYEYVLQFYQGREVYNNIACNQVLHAVNFTDKDFDWYLYPLELDWNIRIKKPKLDKGSGGISEEDWAYKLAYLTAAKTNYEKALELDANYTAAKINLVCIYTLMKEYELAIAYHQSFLNETSWSVLEEEKLKMALAICYSNLVSEQAKASAIFQDLAKSSNNNISFAATYNLRILEEGACGKAQTIECVSPTEMPPTDTVSLHFFTSKQTKIDLAKGYSMTIDQKPNSKIFQYYKENYTLFSFQKSIATSTTILPTFEEGSLYTTISNHEGYSLHCRDSRLVFTFKNDNSLSEWVRYY